MKSLSLLVVVLTFLLQQATAQVLTDFGSDQFTITYSDFTYTQTQTSLQISSSSFGQELSGIISTVIIPASTVELTLTGTLTSSNPGSAFQIALLDSENNDIYFDGSWLSYVSGVETSAVLTLYAPVAGFNGQIVRVALFTGDTGEGLNFTLKELRTTAVPEPCSTLALLMSMIFCAIHFRRRAAT